MPAGTPKVIADKFRADLAKVMQDPEVKEKFALLGVDAVSGTPEQLAELRRSANIERPTPVPNSDAASE